MMHTAEHVEVWQKAVIDGRRRVADLERRATYPADAEEDTLTLAEHYRIRWHQARILKALSYFVDVTPAELCFATGIHPALLTMEVRRVAERVRMRVETERRQDRTVAFYRLAHASDRDEIRAVINSAWHFSETFMPQSRGKKAA
jgi:hypothetical protein